VTQCIYATRNYCFQFGCVEWTKEPARRSSTPDLFPAILLAYSYPEDGGNIFLRNISEHLSNCAGSNAFKAKEVKMSLWLIKNHDIKTYGR
jgi:hypothetical protein